MIAVFSPNGRAFWERHPDHPSGEAFVGNGTATVAETPAVKAALENGRLLKVVQEAADDETAPEVTTVTKRPRKRSNG
jgi:hypothetical protein